MSLRPFDKPVCETSNEGHLYLMIVMISRMCAKEKHTCHFHTPLGSCQRALAVCLLVLKGQLGVFASDTSWSSAPGGGAP